MKLLFSKPSNRSRNSPRTRNHEGITSLARLKTGTRGGAGRGAAGCVTGGGVCVACGVDASDGNGICADAAVAVAMTRRQVRLKTDTAAIRLKGGTTFGE